MKINFFAVIFCLGWFAHPTMHAMEPLAISEGDKIVIIGNTLAERMQFDGDLETRLHARFPDKHLIINNLGWSADEIDLRPRSANFQDHGHNLTDHKPNVVFALFGLNESFGGESQLENFGKRFDAFLASTKSEIGEAELVVFSPIAAENLRRPELPDGQQTNQNIELYSEVMRARCQSAGFRFVDLYTPSKQAMLLSASPLTINGIHLNERGNALVARMIDTALFGEASETTVDLVALRAAVIDRNQLFYKDYRAVNGFYIYGGRKSPYGVVNFPEEFTKLRKMIALRDERIAKIAGGHSVPVTIDDSTTGALSTIESNVGSVPPYLAPGESKSYFDVESGYEIELFASEVEFPDLMNPVAMDIDSKGRVWVTTTPCYPQFLPGTPVNDKVLILEDTDHDGKADKQTVFADGLHLPIGIAIADGGAYVSQQPNLMFLKDTDGDDVADTRERVLHGFDTADSHHSISAFTLGPDGALYMQEGTFHHTQIETPYGPQRVKDAAVFRYEPKTERLSIYTSYSFANPWGHCFDEWGQDFVADASGGANYFAAAFTGDVIYPQKHRQMKQFLTMQWRPTAACLIVNNPHFPDDAQGNYLLNNCIGFLGTLQYKVSDEGSGFHGEPVDPLLSSRDTNFRPIDQKFGPDGSLYIVDWFNPLIGHMQHNLRDPNRDKHHGRIWRIKNTGKPLLDVPTIAGQSPAQLVPLLENDHATIRDLVRRELRLHPVADVVTAVDAWLGTQSGNDTQTQHNRLEALWVMQQIDQIRPDLLAMILKSPDHRARAAATRVLCYWRQRIPAGDAMLLALAEDESPRVRLEAVRAASFFADVDAAREIVSIALTKPLDEYLNYTIAETNATLDRRGGPRSGADEGLIKRLAGGSVTGDQLIAITKVASQEADVSQLARITNAILAAEAPPSQVAAAIREIMLAAKTRKLKPAIDTQLAAQALTNALSQDDPSLATTLAQMAGQWNVEEMIRPLRTAIMDETTPTQTLDASLATVVTFVTPLATDTRGELIRTELPTRLKLHVAKALAGTNNAAAAGALGFAIRQGVDVALSEPLTDATKAVLAGDDGVKRLREELQKSRPDTDSAKLMLRTVYAAGATDDELIALLSDAAGMSGPVKPLTDDERTQLIAQIQSSGDAHRGELVYRRADLNCAQCHVLSGAGGKVGPDLSGVGVNSPVEYLLDSILEPSKQIKEAYLTLNVVTSDGNVVRGVKVDRDDTRLVLRDEKGNEITIAEDDIDAESEGKSLMPEGQHQLMTRTELVDLVAFLSALGRPGDYVVNSRPMIQRYDVLANASVNKSLAAMPEGKMEGELANIAADSWTGFYASVGGAVPRGWLPNGDAPLVLRGAVDVVVAGPVGVHVTCDAKAQVVIDGKSVASNGQQFVDMTTGRHEIHIVVESPEGFETLETEFTKPTGASTQFTVVGGI